MLRQIKIVSHSEKPLDIDVIFNDDGFIFCLNHQLLETIQTFQYNPSFDKYVNIQIPYRFELLEEAVLYGFIFITKYEADGTDFKPNANEKNIEAFSQSNKYVIRTSVSLDGGTFNQISKKGLDCLDLSVYSLVFSIHQWLVSRVLQSFKNQIERGFTLIYTKVLAVIWSVSFGCSIVSVISSGTFQASYIFLLKFLFFNSIPLLLIPFKKFLLPILLKWLWRQLINPSPRSKIARALRQFAKGLL